MREATGRPDLRFLIDSGAFSANSLGKEIDPEGYAEWIKDREGLISHYLNLDVIMDPKGSASNLAVLEELGITPTPVFHAGSPIKIFEEMVERHDLVAVGNLVGINKRSPKLWALLDSLHAKAADQGCGLHGLGLSAWSLLRRWPWASIDSSSVCSGYMYGRALLFNFYEDCWISMPTKDDSEWGRWGWLLREYGFEPDHFAKATRKELRTRLMTLQAAQWAVADACLPETSCFLVDPNFRDSTDGSNLDIWHYEKGIQIGEAVAKERDLGRTKGFEKSEKE